MLHIKNNEIIAELVHEQNLCTLYWKHKDKRSRFDNNIQDYIEKVFYFKIRIYQNKNPRIP